jgi:sterol desaturase/sphingolipid hydroxylase (fatty acid hydroxylase superfamily)
MGDLAVTVLRQFLLFSAILSPLEILWPTRHRPRSLGELKTDLAHLMLDPFLIVGASATLLAFMGAAINALVPQGARVAVAAQPFGLQLAEVFVLSELGSYAAHRLAHAVPLLWRLHAVHHSARELAWVAAHRQHPLETIWMLGVANLPAMVLGFDLSALTGLILLQKAYNAFLHANTRTRYGRLTQVLASPQFHHWHHDADSKDHNFAAALSILDVIFGTYRVPAGFPERYGLDEAVPRGYLGQLLCPFIAATSARLRADIRRWPEVRYARWASAGAGDPPPASSRGAGR